jgi:hypothetical protein
MRETALIFVAMLGAAAPAAAMDFAVLGHGVASRQNANSSLGESQSDAYLNFGGGAQLEFPLGESFAIETGLDYLEYQYSYGGTDVDTIAALRAPAGIQLRWSTNFLTLGGYLSEALGGVQREGAAGRQTLDFAAAGVNRFEFGWAAGITHLWPLGSATAVLLKASYQRSVSNPFSAPGVSGVNQALVISAGFRLGELQGAPFLD